MGEELEDHVELIGEPERRHSPPPRSPDSLIDGCFAVGCLLVLALVGGGAIWLYSWWSDHGRQQSQATAADEAHDAVGPVRQQVEGLQAEVETLRYELDRMREELNEHRAEPRHNGW